MNFLRPRRLVRGSHVRILSPSGPVRDDLLDAARTTLSDWGLTVSLDDATFARSRYLAGSDDLRRAALQRALAAPDVDAVLFSRGGYGAMRILDGLDWAPLQRDPRLLCGFSDITAIHLAAQAHGLATLHGHVAKSFATQADDLEVLRATLFGERGPVALDVTPIAPGTATGPVLGGNLSLVAAMAASHLAPRFDGAILFLEDVTEEDYRLDRLFTSLRLSPAFRGVAGVILGEFDQCAGTYVTTEEMPAFLAGLGGELAEAWGVPVVAGFPAGHAGRNFPLPFGIPATVDGTAGQVRLTEELVT